MKKLLAAGCCVIALQSFAQPNTSSGSSADGRRVLMKAIAGIVNNEANRKFPPRRIHIPNLESPDF